MHWGLLERTGGRQLRRNAPGVGNWVSCDARTRQQQNVTPLAAGWSAGLVVLAGDDPVVPDRFAC